MRHAAGVLPAAPVPAPMARFRSIVFGFKPTPRWYACCACGWRSLGRTTSEAQALEWATEHVLVLA
jgi:hypothetical protein